MEVEETVSLHETEIGWCRFAPW